jgi:uncharacterized membrane protein YkvA (DUF1232 family)
MGAVECDIRQQRVTRGKEEKSMSDDQSDFYKSFRQNVRAWVDNPGDHGKWAEYVMALPDLAHLLFKLAVDTEVPVDEKAKLAAAIAYIVSPIDLIPEAIVGRVGYVDDVAVAGYVLNSIITATKPEVVKKHWAGDQDVLNLVERILHVADEMVGSGLWRRLKSLLEPS